jgi:hypothetical protein
MSNQHNMSGSIQLAYLIVVSIVIAVGTVPRGTVKGDKSGRRFCDRLPLRLEPSFEAAVENASSVRAFCRVLKHQCFARSGP